MKIKGILVFILMASFIVLLVGPVAGKSVYLSANHHTRQFDAWNINPNGTISKQATYSLNYATNPAGIAIDVVTGEGNDPLMFVTTEGIGGIEVINPVTLQFHGVAPGPVNMGGVDVDDIDNIIYAIQRGTSGFGGNGTSELYIYSYNDDGTDITQQAHITLPNHGRGFSLAFDDLRDILWVGDYQYSMVKAYDVNVAAWTDIAEIPSLSFSASHNVIDVAVDKERNLVYTVAAWAGSPLLSKYDVTTGIETTVNLGIGGIGVAVDEISGYVYITRGTSSYGDDIQVWDCSTSPFALIQDTPRIGNPAGIAIANVSYNPLNLAKNDDVQGYGVFIGQTFTYEITCENTDILNDKTGVIIVDNMPVELDFVSEAVGGVPGTGVYDPNTHTVTWAIGTVPAGQPGPLVELEVLVNQNAIPNTTIYNLCTIISEQGDTTTVEGNDPDNPDPDDPGTVIIPPIELVSPEEGDVLDNGCDDLSDSIVWDFSWLDVVGATKYHLYVEHPGAAIPAIDDSNIVATSYHYNCVACYIADANRLGWQWSVRAFIDGAWTGWSNVRTFDVEPLNTDCGIPEISVLIVPDDWFSGWASNPRGTVRAVFYNYPTGYTNTNINASTVVLNDAVPAIGSRMLMRPWYPGTTGPVAIGGFMRQNAILTLGSLDPGVYTCTFTGQFTDGQAFTAETDITLHTGLPKEGESEIIPGTYSVSQNYPNPFNAWTTIEYGLPEANFVTLEIYDILGRRVETLVSSEQSAGYHSVTWNANDVSTGVYFYRIQAGEFSEMKKMSLLK